MARARHGSRFAPITARPRGSISNTLGGVADFSPDDIEVSANGVLWLKADTAVFQGSDCTTVAGDNDVVGCWQDQFASGNNVIQATTANKPLLRLAHVNGLPAIQWDGANDVLQNASFANFGDAYTAFIVGRYNSSGDNSNALFEVSNGAENTGFALFHVAAATRFRAHDAAVNRDVDGASIRDDTYYLHTVHNTGSELQYWHDNASQGTIAYTAPNPNTTDQIDVGAKASANWNLDGYTAELIIYNALLSAANRGSVNTYLANRYGITLS